MMGMGKERERLRRGLHYWDWELLNRRQSLEQVELVVVRSTVVDRRNDRMGEGTNL